MSALWHYASDGKQMDPVSMAELQQLAAKGFLKPTDLVWKDGMANWTKASAVKGLFPSSASGSSSAIAVSRKTEPATPVRRQEDDAPRRKSRDDEDDRPRRRSRDEEDDDDRPRRRRRPRNDGGNLGLKVALIGGGVAVALVLVVIVIIVAVRAGGRQGVQPPFAVNGVPQPAGGGDLPAPPAGGAEVLRFSVDLNENAQDQRVVQLKKGHSYEAHLRSDFPSDVDLFVKSPENQIIASDDTVGPNGYVRFFARTDGAYAVIVDNLGPGRNRANVVVHQLAGDPVAVAPPGVNPPPVFNPPPVVNPAGGTRIPVGRLLPGRRITVTRNLPANPNLRIRVESAVVGNTDVDLFVRRGGMQVASDQGFSAQCLVQFASPGGDHQIDVVNLGPGSATCVIVIE